MTQANATKVTKSTKTNAAIDLRPFCAESSRFMFAAPWVRDGHRYATDGHLCVRLPATGEADTLQADGGPVILDAAVLFSGGRGSIDAAGDALPWPVNAEVSSEQQPCDRCGGFGRRSGLPCDACDGTGSVTEDIGVFVGVHFIGAKLHRLICSLPNPVYFPGDNDLRPLAFAFDDGGEGRVMGSRDGHRFRKTKETWSPK